MICNNCNFINKADDDIMCFKGHYDTLDENKHKNIFSKLIIDNCKFINPSGIRLFYGNFINTFNIEVNNVHTDILVQTWYYASGTSIKLNNCIINEANRPWAADNQTITFYNSLIGIQNTTQSQCKYYGCRKINTYEIVPDSVTGQ